MADVEGKIAELRQHFLSKYEGSILDDSYDERDVNEIKTSDSLLRCVLRAYGTGGDIKKAADLLNEVFLFRVKYKIRELKESDLHPELREKGGIYFHGVDKQGHKLLHFRVCKQKKGHLVEESKKVIAYYIYQHYKDTPESPVVFLFDFVDAGITNMDMDITKFIIKCANTYFPEVSAYSLMFKMGLALEAIWKIIKGFMDRDQTKKTYLVKRSTITEYVNPDQLLPHMLKEDKDKK